MATVFPEIKKLLGFGCMRLPMQGEEVDVPQVRQMVDRFLEEGFNYFDTAHGYIDGKSEIALREALTARYPREKYLLTDKLTGSYFKTEAEIRPFFEEQLRICGVEYFDFYLMHAQNSRNFEEFKACRAYETAFALKAEGKIRHVGISFHDKADVLDRILTEYPEIEVVQIQFNYVDFDDPSIEAGKVYEIARKHKKPVFIMEPVKGGNLVNLPAEADAVLRALRGGSNASYAIRFAAGFDGVCAVLSGMSSLEQMEDNLSYMKDFRPLDREEREAIDRVLEVFHGLNLIPCTACRYCIEENQCPMGIRIPAMFSCLNKKTAFDDWNQDYFYHTYLVGDGHGKASDCVGCGGCEAVCPQHLPIIDLLTKVADQFDKNNETD